MRISDWSSDVCSSDLAHRHPVGHLHHAVAHHPLTAPKAVCYFHQPVLAGACLHGGSGDLPVITYDKTVASLALAQHGQFRKTPPVARGCLDAYRHQPARPELSVRIGQYHPDPHRTPIGINDRTTLVTGQSVTVG